MGKKLITITGDDQTESVEKSTILSTESKTKNER